MAILNKSRSTQVTREFLLDFCETGMNDHTTRLYKAFYDRNLETLREVSMNYERDCYSIGAIEIVGKLIKLRLFLQDDQADSLLIERILNSIADQSAKVQGFLIHHIQSSEGALVLNNIHYVSRISEPSAAMRHSWYIQNCYIQ